MTIMAMTTRRTLAIVATSLLLGGVAAACGDDDSDTSTKKDDTPAAVAAKSKNDAYCDAELKVEKTALETGGPESDPVAGAKALLAVAEKAKALAPPEIAAKFAGPIGVLQDVVKTGDGSKMESIDTSEVHKLDLQACGWTTHDVTVAEYHFGGIPTTLDAGVHSFEVHNDGTEPHVMLVLRKAPGVTQSFDDLLSSGAWATDKTVAAGAGFAPPGADGYAVGDLQPGEYVVICPIATGTTAQKEGSGPPHFMNGMKAQLTVK
jgi:hypothetical protein